MSTRLCAVSMLASLMLATQPAAAAEKSRLNAVGISVGSLDNPYFKALVRGALGEIRSINPTAARTTIPPSTPNGPLN